MIRKYFISSVVLVFILSIAFSISGHTASADIYQPWLQCAQSNGYWSSTGCVYDVVMTPTAQIPTPAGCWYSHQDQQSGNGGGIYDIGKPELTSCNAYYNESNTNGQVLTMTWQDAGNPSQCALTSPYYSGDNCTAAVPATMSVVQNGCPAGGTWAFSPGGYTGSPLTVYVDAGGTAYSVAYNAPSGYTYTWDTPSSQMAYPGSSNTYSVTCHHQLVPPASVTLTATPPSLQCGSSANLHWEGTNLTSCSSDWTGSTGVSGDQSVSPTLTKSYSISCVAIDGSIVSSSATVTVTNSCPSGQPTVTLTASPSTITAGQSSTLTWSTSGPIAPNSCSTYWTNQTGTSGSESVSPAVTTPYSIVCHGTDNNSTPIYGSTQVTVNPTSVPIFIMTNVAGGGGTVNPGGLSGGTVGIGYYGYVSPSPSGTTYTITPYTVPGYTYDHVADGQGGPDGTSAILYPLSGQSKFFDVIYTQNSSGPTFTYTLSNSGPNSVTAGATTQETITKTLTSGTAGSVSLAVSGLPSGVTVTGISGQGCTLNCISTITLAVDSSVSQGSHAITVTGTPGNITTQFNLNVNSSSNISVNCLANPAVAKVGQPITWTASAGGGTGIFTDYQWSGSGIPNAPPTHTAGNTYSVTYSTVGQKAVTATVTDSNNKSGTCTAGTAIVNISPTFQEF